MLRWPPKISLRQTVRTRKIGRGTYNGAGTIGGGSIECSFGFGRIALGGRIVEENGKLV